MHNSNEIKALLKVEIITPINSFSFSNVSMVSLPGSEGEFGVLPGHVALISELQPGIISIYGNHSKILGRFSTSVGFVEVTNKSVVILLESLQIPN